MADLVVLLFCAQMGMILVNGWTDAPNAILSAVCGKALTYRQAVRLAAICNFLGVLVFSKLNPAVSTTVYEMVRLDFSPLESAVLLLCAMLTVIFYGTVAWWLGIPTSESHALLAGVTGSAVAFGGWEYVSGEQWLKVLYGLFLSLPIGLLLGCSATLLLQKPFERLNGNLQKKIQIAAAAFMAFAHSAQDGLKFTGMFLMMNSVLTVPVTIFEGALLTAVAMTAGTLLGGKRIIVHVGEKMTALDKIGGLTSDFAGIVCLTAATFGGLPVSTTHTKTMAVAGAGLVRDRKRFSGRLLAQMILCWLLTFPVCGLMGWLLAVFMQKIPLG